MTMPRARTRWFALAVLVTVLSVGLQVPAEADHRRSSSPQRIALPDGFRPEGIAIGTRPVAYLGSLGDGDIYAADLPHGPAGQIGAGLGMATSNGTISLKAPTVDVTHTGQEAVIDGVRVVFQVTPGTEAVAASSAAGRRAEARVPTSPAASGRHRCIPPRQTTKPQG